MRLADKLRVRVLRKHIVAGLKGVERGDIITACVVAQALRTKFPRTRYITVGVATAHIGGSRYTVAKAGQSFIRRVMGYGRGPVKPTTITLTRDGK